MKDFLMSVLPIGLWVMAGLELIFLALFLRKTGSGKKALSWLMAGITFGLLYDAAILASGTVMEEGSLLKGLSQFRFVFHCGLIPLIFPLCGEALGMKKPVRESVYAVTALISLIGIAAGFSIVLEAMPIGGVMRYGTDKALTPSWANGIQSALSFGPVLVLIICGLIVWIRKHNPWLCLAGLLMLFFAALGPASGNKELMFFITMIGEALMTGCFWLYLHTIRKE